MVDVMQKVDELRRRLDEMNEPPGHMLIGDVNRTNQGIFVDTVKLMLDLIEDSILLRSIIAIEKKIGIDNSEDPHSLDYRVHALERRLDHLDVIAG